MNRLAITFLVAAAAVGSSAWSLASAASPSAATTFYVSASGNDANSGTSPAAAWRTTARANQEPLGPGDQVLFEGRSTFSGPLELTTAESGTADAPIVFSSYGSGRATIDGDNGTGILVYDAAGVKITNLTIVGSGAATNSGSGINVFNDLPGGTKLPYVHISDVTVKGFGNYGVAIGGWNGSSGFRDVVVTRTDVVRNRKAGLITYGPFDPSSPSYANRDVAVSYVRAYNNDGDPGDLIHNSGSGIVLGSVRNGSIERSVAHDNGALCHADECGVGIWAYDSTAVTIQFNLSYRNETGGSTDGDGFDLDQNTSDSVVQYNYSYDNDGAGFLLFCGPVTGAHRNNTVRYNISQNDGRQNSLGAISAGGDISGDAVYNNTVYLSAPDHGRPPAVLFVSGTVGVTVRNNILYVAGELPLVSAPDLATTAVDFQRNDYFTPTGAFEVDWGSAVYSTLRDWQRATAQEMFDRTPSGLVVDPGIDAPGAGPSLRSATRLDDVTAYKLQPDSQLRDVGLDLARTFGIAMGGRDYFGVSVPSGTAPELGAAELPH